MIMDRVIILKARAMGKSYSMNLNQEWSRSWRQWNKMVRSFLDRLIDWEPIKIE